MKKRDKTEIIAMYKKQYEGKIEHHPIIIKPLLGMIATAAISVLVARLMENPTELQGEAYTTIDLLVIILLPLSINIAMLIMSEMMDEERKQHPSLERWVQNQIVEELFCQHVGIQSTARKEK